MQTYYGVMWLSLCKRLCTHSVVFYIQTWQQNLSRQHLSKQRIHWTTSRCWKCTQCGMNVRCCRTSCCSIHQRSQRASWRCWWWPRRCWDKLNTASKLKVWISAVTITWWMVSNAPFVWKYSRIIHKLKLLFGCMLHWKAPRCFWSQPSEAHSSFTHCLHKSNLLSCCPFKM